jgi:pimeloyl-ACP methyl ester carboxylesterase
MRRLARLVALAALAAAGAGCAVPARAPEPPSGLRSPFTGYASDRYRDPRWWLCLPGREDACAHDLDATELLPDGTRVEVRDTQAPGSDQVDCFYVYPTVDLRPWPASHEDFSDLGPMTFATVAQAARLRYACRLYVPLYRQTSFGAYFPGDAIRKPYRQVAESDVVDAFLEYMARYNGGRKIVLVGHSQGGEMVVHLLRRFFDDDPAMREKLLLAMPLGWPVEVARGQTTGGTFTHLPVCTHPGETGCVVAFRTYDADGEAKPGRAMPAPGHESVCVNPAELVHGKPEPFSRAFFGVPGKLFAMRGVESMRTPFVMLRDFYTGRCVDGPRGFRYLAVSVTPAPDDRRVSPFDLSIVWFHGELGTHVLDMQFTQGDLVDLVAQRAAALVHWRPPTADQPASFSSSARPSASDRPESSR